MRFDQVTVYYFARRQGFTSVPSQGGSSLGMAQRHNSVRRYTLCEFAQEQEVNHREILREHLKEEKLHAKKMKVRPRAAKGAHGEGGTQAAASSGFWGSSALFCAFFFNFCCHCSCCLVTLMLPPSLLESPDKPLQGCAGGNSSLGSGCARGGSGSRSGWLCPFPFPNPSPITGAGCAPLGVASGPGFVSQRCFV